MPFLTTADYSVAVRNEIKTMLTDNSEVKLQTAENQALAQIKTYVGGRIDCNALFTQTGADRDAFIVMIAIDLVLYHLYSGFAPKLMPEHRNNRYDDAIKWLTKVGNAEIPTQFPTIADADNTDCKINSYPKQNQRF